MKDQDYNATISVKASPAEAFEKIARVGDWWAKNFKGNALHTGDTFTVTFGKTWVDFKIADATPGKRSVWDVTGCYLEWLNDKTEWNGTKVVWEISEANHATQIKMTHVGLTPDVECYASCNAGWTGHITKSLVNLMNDNIGQPE
jgi:hypothetical protein